MAHIEQIKYCESLRDKFPQYFRDKKILDIGSLDINGNNRYLFENCEYIGLDIIGGENVDVVCIAHEYNAPDGSFDVVLSTNAMEHDIYYPLTLKKMVSLLKAGGLMFFSVSNSHPEHGTARISPMYSGTSQANGDWKNYYKNLGPDDIKRSINMDKIFNKYELRIEGMDLQFWGIKKLRVRKNWLGWLT